jgi:hypothetical protein
MKKEKGRYKGFFEGLSVRDALGTSGIQKAGDV